MKRTKLEDKIMMNDSIHYINFNDNQSEELYKTYNQLKDMLKDTKDTEVELYTGYGNSVRIFTTLEGIELEKLMKRVMLV